ncbi:MAG: hypothetical protein WC405_09055 [Syntrophales bacterium]
MRKRWIGFLMALLVVFLGCSGGGEKASVDPAKKEAATSKKPLVNDFRGIKWFTKKSEIQGFEGGFEKEYHNQYTKRSFWNKKDENASLGDTPLRSIDYVFCNVKKKGGDGEFCEVKIEYDSINYEKLVSFFTQTLNVSPAQDYKQEPNIFESGGTINTTTALWDLPSIKIEIVKSYKTSDGIWTTRCHITPKKEKSKTGGGL